MEKLHTMVLKEKYAFSYIYDRVGCFSFGKCKKCTNDVKIVVLKKR